MLIHKVTRVFSSKFRAKRMAKFEKEFKLNDAVDILDVGGDQYNWQFVEANPQLTIVNLYTPKDWDYSKTNMKSVIGDGTRLGFKDKEFSLVYSNSVIEHLFSFENQQAFADEIKRVGKSYYVQTPAKEFFVEPHVVTPFIHWFPQNVQRKLMRNFTVWGLLMRPTQEYIDNFLNERKLLTYKAFKSLFPDATIKREKFLFFTKSYIAIKN
ncbi:MAG: methyltransferase domain-containing protein [Bacteroidetes bacterium]|nr:methyltransferase domain-containing protein [Bacteroidota bacterium]